MIFSFFLVKARYHWTQILGVLICIAGLGLTVISDWQTDKVSRRAIHFRLNRRAGLIS